MQDNASGQPQLFLVPGDTSSSTEIGATASRPTRQRSVRIVDLTRWSRRQLLWIRPAQNPAVTDELFIYQQAAKLVEEVGELHSELLGRSSLQRQEKGTYTRASLAEECADVAITLAILAEVLDVNLSAAVASKMDKVEERRKANLSARFEPSS